MFKVYSEQDLEVVKRVGREYGYELEKYDEQHRIVAFNHKSKDIYVDGRMYERNFGVRIFIKVTVVATGTLSEKRLWNMTRKTDPEISLICNAHLDFFELYYNNVTIVYEGNETVAEFEIEVKGDTNEGSADAESKSEAWFGFFDELKTGLPDAFLIGGKQYGVTSAYISDR